MDLRPILPRQRIHQLAVAFLAFGCTALLTPAISRAFATPLTPAVAPALAAPFASASASPSTSPVAAPSMAAPAPPLAATFAAPSTSASASTFVAPNASTPAAPLTPTAPADDPRFTWPLHPRPQLIRGFDAPETDFGPGHRGVDLAAAADQQVLSAGTGYVVFAGTIAGRGVVSIDHDGGLRTTYEPLVPQVAAGDQVYAGQVIGTVTAGHPECAVPVCLHWGVRRGLEYLDPLPLVQETTRLRLKPWDSG